MGLVVQHAGSFQIRVPAYVSCVVQWILYSWGTGEALPVLELCISLIVTVSIFSCACCCCVASVSSDSVWPLRWQPTRLRHPWDSPGKNTGVGCHFLLQCMKVKVKSLSRVWLFATSWTAAHQAPLPVGFSRQEYWSRLPLPSPSHVLTGRLCRFWVSQVAQW